MLQRFRSNIILAGTFLIMIFFASPVFAGAEGIVGTVGARGTVGGARTIGIAKKPKKIKAAVHKSEKQTFEKLFNQWTKAFNSKNLKGTCGLYSKSVVAKYRGVPKKNYDTICVGFEKLFKEKDKKYQYSFEIHDVHLEKNLAVVRITWYLQVTEKGRYKSVTQEEGIDVLQKDEKGQWKIVQYLAYAE